MQNQADSRMMENLYWWGIPTLFRCPHETNFENCDIGLVGVPHSSGNGTTEKDQHLGPRAVRNVSALLRRVHLDMGFDPWETARISDLGDVPLPEANDNEASVQRITDYYKLIDKAGIRPVSIGGDHSITGGIVQALGCGNLTKGEKISFPSHRCPYRCFYESASFFGCQKVCCTLGRIFGRSRAS